MISLRAHPEIWFAFAMKILHDDDTIYTEGQSQEDVEEMIKNVEGPRDGLALFRRAIEWHRKPELVPSSQSEGDLVYCTYYTSSSSSI
jgi:hypothetical protein